MLMKTLAGISVVGILCLAVAIAINNKNETDKRKACTEMLARFCAKAEECAAIPMAECLTNVSCPEEIMSSVSQIRACQNDLATADCGMPPQSCLELE